MENETPDFIHERDALGLEKPKVIVENTEQVDSIVVENLDVIYASLGSRILAYFLDVLILILPLLVLENMIFGEEFTSSKDSLWRNLFNMVCWTLYYGLTESSDGQATIGKRICGLKVIDEKGEKLTFKKASLRYLAQILSVLPLGFGIWAIATDSKKQAWHDMLLGCYVIKNKSNGSATKLE